jgi:hypothetical protein
MDDDLMAAVKAFLDLREQPTMEIERGAARVLGVTTHTIRSSRLQVHSARIVAAAVAHYRMLTEGPEEEDYEEPAAHY